MVSERPSEEVAFGPRPGCRGGTERSRARAGAGPRVWEDRRRRREVGGEGAGRPGGLCRAPLWEKLAGTPRAPDCPGAPPPRADVSFLVTPTIHGADTTRWLPSLPCSRRSHVTRAHQWEAPWASSQGTGRRWRRAEAAGTVLGSLALPGTRAGGVSLPGSAGLGLGSGGLPGAALVWAALDPPEAAEPSRPPWVLRASWGLHRARGPASLERVGDARAPTLRPESRARASPGRGGWCVR